MGRRLIGLCWIALLLSGCWSRVEVNDLGVVLGMAVDVGEEAPIRLTLLYGRQGSGQQGEAKPTGGDPVWVVAREAGNLSDAMREIALAAARQTSLHHLRVVLISEEFARRGIKDLLDFLARNPQARMSIQPMVVEGRAQTVLETPPQLKSFQPQNLAAMIEEKGGPRVTLKEFLVARVSDTHSGWMYSVKVIVRPARTPEAPATAVTLSGAALFEQDHLVRLLSPREARGLAWLLGEPERSVISAPCPDAPELSFSGQVSEGSIAIRPTWNGGTLGFTVLARGKADLIRLTCRDKLGDPGWRAELEKSLSTDVKERVADLIADLQSNRIDSVGFGKRVQLADPGWWRQNGPKWLEIWPKTPVSVSADIEIVQSGLLLKPANLTEQELGESGE